jgi:antitoxin YefM
MVITASEARKHLFPLIEQVNDDRTPVEITSKRGDAVLICSADHRALEETAHLLRSPANVRRLSKPEQLRHALAGAWSRRNDAEHRLVYLVDGDDVVILQARYHYG